MESHEALLPVNLAARWLLSRAWREAFQSSSKGGYMNQFFLNHGSVSVITHLIFGMV